MKISRAAVGAILAIMVAACTPVGGATPASGTLQSETPTPVSPSTPSASPPVPKPAPPPTAEPGLKEISATFTAVVDGDTIKTSAGTVRLIGIDTPERGECGYDEAAMIIGKLLAHGDPITLELPEGQNDTDRYDRLIRYVRTSGGIDLGLLELETGNAIARYDSRDGYPEHPREAEYHAAQTATINQNGQVQTTSCAEAVAPLVAPSSSSSNEESGDEEWWYQYSSCTKLKQNTVGDPKGPFDVNNPAEKEIYDWFAYGTGHRGDGDGDGLACE